MLTAVLIVKCVCTLWMVVSWIHMYLRVRAACKRLNESAMRAVWWTIPFGVLAIAVIWVVDWISKTL